MRLPFIAIAFCLALVAYALNAPDSLADHGYGCGAPAAAGCAGADYGCHSGYADAGCARGPLLTRQPVRRIVRGTLRVATAPVRAVARARFVPSRRFGCGG